MNFKNIFSSSTQEKFVNFQNEDLTEELAILSKTKFARSVQNFKKDILFYLTKKEAKTCIESEEMISYYVNYAIVRADERGEFEL